MPPLDLFPPQPAASPPWLSIVGIGEDGIAGLGNAAHAVIGAAAAVFGGTRHLALAGPLIRGMPRPWAVPFDSTMSEVLALRGQSVCVLASGDPFLHGVGSLLARHVTPRETVVFPAPSAFSLAAARLLWPLPQVAMLSLCGRPLQHVLPHLHPGARILALTSNGAAPAEIASLLCDSGFGASRITVLELLGGAQERVRSAYAYAFDLDAIVPLNTVAIEAAADAGARILSCAPGLPDYLFEHDGQITKREIRALTLSALAPRRGELLWDVGAGSGSVAIEWLLADASLEAIAIEQDRDRVQRIVRNAAACGVPQLTVVEGAAPAAIAGLTTPDAIFIGGGAAAPHVIETLQTALRPQGRLVANAVSLETEGVLLKYHAQCGGSLTRIAIARASPIGGEHGRMTGWRAAMQITQWLWVKP